MALIVKPVDREPRIIEFPGDRIVPAEVLSQAMDDNNDGPRRDGRVDSHTDIHTGGAGRDH